MELTTRQKKIAQILVFYAKNGRTIYYKELGEMPGVELHHRHVGREIGEVSKKCTELGLPPISAIVINSATGKPGAGFNSVSHFNSIDAAIYEVFAQNDWSKLLQHVNEEAEATAYELESATEGLPKEQKSISRTRNAKLRDRAIKESRGICKICGFDAKKKYGEQFAGKIHIHHKKPLALYGGTQTTMNDLIAVCPNCHMILHSKGNGDVFTPEEVIELINKSVIP